MHRCSIRRRLVRLAEAPILPVRDGRGVGVNCGFGIDGRGVDYPFRGFIFELTVVSFWSGWKLSGIL